MGNKSIIVLCIISIALSCAALCMSYLRCEPITMDWMGVLVGILSLLVTFLLGWQIYTMFDIRKIQEEVKKDKTEANINMERRMAEAHCALWLFYQSKIEEAHQDEMLLLCACLQSGIAAIYHFSQCGEYKMAGSCCSSLVRLEETIIHTKLESDMIQSQIQVLLSMKNQNKIQGYGELLSILYKCLK